MGDKQLARLTPKDVRQFYEKLGGSLASGTVRRIHTTLHGALKAAQQAHLIASNPTEWSEINSDGRAAGCFRESHHGG
nr:hypothetical protein [uncultured Oscillibacter sp.]